MHTHATGVGAPGFLALSGIWFAMMALMMAPTVWPWVRAFHLFGSRGDNLTARGIATATFVSGYLTAWLLYSTAAAGFQLQIAPTRYIGAGLLAGAGLFQLASLKRACLTHCRSPYSYFLVRWRNGPAGGFRIGFGHGIFCVGCCWALMATALAVGVMNLWWMAALTVTAFAEQALPNGDRLRVPVGVALVAAGMLRATAFP
jgi:predicted metal-binding membrane protein